MDGIARIIEQTDEYTVWDYPVWGIIKIYHFPQLMEKMIIRHNPAGRNALSLLFKGVGAEIGTERGKFAEVIAETCDKLYCVDLWKNYPGYREHVSDAQYEEIFQDAQKRLSRKDVEFIRASSQEASLSIPHGSLDFVYIDAAHDYQSVKADLLTWYFKVKPGGVVAGHDYVKKVDFGVIEAVNEFCQSVGIEELVIFKGDKSPSWMFIKPE